MQVSKSLVRALSEISLNCAPALFQGPHLLTDRAHTRDVRAHSEGLLLSLTAPTAHGAHGRDACIKNYLHTSTHRAACWRSPLYWACWELLPPLLKELC